MTVTDATGGRSRNLVLAAMIVAVAAIIAVAAVVACAGLRPGLQEEPAADRDDPDGRHATDLAVAGG
jgi:hypothetical protein